MLLCAVTLAAQPGQPPLALPDSEVEETYLAYSALMRQELGKRDASKVLIIAYTHGGRDDASCLKPPEGKNAAQYMEQISRYLERNRSAYRLFARFDIGRPYELVNTIPTAGLGWPTSHISLSAIGFNTAQDRAVVYMEYGGMGGAYFLTKEAGKWTVDFQRQPRTCGWIE
jgi:hypothetical protein